MPNKKGGKKYKNKKKGVYISKELIKREIENFEEYGYIKRKLGNGRFEVFCYDGIERMGIISGKMRKRVWIDVNTFVLVAKWEFQDEKCHIIHKYEDNDLQKLVSAQEITRNFINLTNDTDFQNSSEDELFDHEIHDTSESESESEEEINLDEI